MRRGKSKKVSMILAIILLLTMLPVSVSADNNAEEKGAITVKLPVLGHTREGAFLAICKVADFDEQGNFAIVADFAEAEIDFSDMDTSAKQRAAAQKLKVHAPEEPLHEVALSDAKEEVTFADLEHGVYVIYGTEMAHYGHIDPSIVSVPYVTEEGVTKYSREVVLKGEKPNEWELPTPTPSGTPTPSVTPTPSGTPTPTPTGEPKKTPGGSDGSGSSSSGGSGGARTGDTTPILGFSIIALASLAVVITVVKKRKRS